MMWYWGPWGGWWMLIGAVLMIIFWAGIIWLIVWGIRRSTRRNNTPSGMTPLDIAKERYARGEITKEQFDEIKRNL